MKYFLFLSTLLLLTVNKGYGKRVMCYYTNWATYRPGDGRFSVEDIDPNLCTHIIYSFARVQGNDLAPTEANDLEMYQKINALKQQNPDLKVLLAVGGWNHPAGPFTQMVSTEQSRKEFADNSYNFLKKYGFDGLDLDWEYPADRGSPPEDRGRFTKLVQQLSEKYTPDGMLLSAATPAAPSRYDGSYEPEVCKYFDFVNIMAYDYSGQWERHAGHNSPLTSQKQTVEHMLTKPDCTPEKLNLGMGSYGRTHQLTNPQNHNIGAPTVGSGAVAGPYTGESGFMSYYEVCEKLKEGWIREWSDKHGVPYAHSGTNWVGYDDRESIALKAEYVNQMNLGGAMFWTLDLDDFRGTKCNEGKYPLINTAKDIVNGGNAPTRPPTTRTTSTKPSITLTSTAATLTTTTLTTTTTTKATDQSDIAALYCVDSKVKQIYANVSTNCRNYYECLTTPTGKQITLTRTCPEPLIYVEEQKKCVKEKDITNVQFKCSTKLKIPAPMTTSTGCWDSSLILTDSMCRFFTDCSIKQRFECPPNTAFEKNIKQCVPKQAITCWW